MRGYGDPRTFKEIWGPLSGGNGAGGHTGARDTPRAPPPKLPSQPHTFPPPHCHPSPTPSPPTAIPAPYLPPSPPHCHLPASFLPGPTPGGQNRGALGGPRFAFVVPFNRQGGGEEGGGDPTFRGSAARGGRGENKGGSAAQPGGDGRGGGGRDGGVHRREGGGKEDATRSRDGFGAGGIGGRGGRGQSFAEP